MRKRGLLLLVLLLTCIHLFAQVLEKVFVPQPGDKKWLTVGSLHNFFSEYGCEAESSRSGPQQDGLQWPAFYNYQDNQAAKGFWIGAKNITDENGKTWPLRIAHVGPRASGVDEFFPVDFRLISRFDDPAPTVEGIESKKVEVEIDEIDPTIPCDRMIVNEVNSLLGITMKRRILQWSQQYHDNYMIMEYEFINTGNVDGDADIELPNQTLNDVYFFWQYRFSMTRQTRYLIGNASGWGINTMNDARGDGPENIAKYGDPEDERFRAQFAWHGYYGDKAVGYDNIGAPIWQPDDQGYIAEYDTVGRLGAPQFAGVVTIHADKSASIKEDDPEQPSTTAFVGSDEPETSANSNAFNEALMAQEFGWIELGHTDRHARVIQPDGNFAAQNKTANISPGEGGGFSFANGYGPYSMAPGDTIRIVLAEAVAGLSYNSSIDVGQRYKDGAISALQKNQMFMTGRDSLFQSFRRAIANYESGYQIEKGPLPVAMFDATGGGDKVTLTWELFPEGAGDISGFNLYRAQGRVDAEPELLYSAGADERSYEDKTALRGLGYYYYIETIGQAAKPQPDLGIPANNLKSNRLFSQTYDPVSLKRPAGNLDLFATKNSPVRVVPNPYIEKFRNEFAFSSNPRELGYISFFNIPGQCTIDIYTELGEKIFTIDHNDGSGDETWKLVTEDNQVVASGIYLAVIKSKETGKKEIVKFVVIR